MCYSSSNPPKLPLNLRGFQGLISKHSVKGTNVHFLLLSQLGLGSASTDVAS